MLVKDPPQFLSPIDLAIYHSLLEAGVLEKVNGSMLPVEIVWDNTVMAFIIVCSDGHRFKNGYDFLLDKVTQSTNQELLPHVFADHGKPLWLAHNSPLNVRHRGANLLESIGAVPEIKGIASGMIIPHAPCAAATLCELNVAQQLQFAKEGKILIVEQHPKMNIACLVQLALPGEGEKTFRVKGEAWRRWAREHPNYLVP